MEHRHVSAGSFFVGSRQPLVLDAYLATCVGIALVDETHGIGGLAHFLLPEPVSLSGAFQPEKYASTGLPLFLKALSEAGARRDRLKATIAGGALIGPVGELDLSLNIGGRTAETAEAILHQEGIALARAETGGVWACCLSLDMRSLSCSVAAGDPLGTANQPPGPQPRPAEIDLALEKLQPIPQVALKIMQLIDEGEQYDVRVLTAEIRKDQVISARTLQLANSVMFASRNRIESLDYALLYLGVNLLMRYVITAAVDSFFDRPAAGYSLCKGGLYHHAVGTAVVAENLARLTGRAKPALAYTAGLLHDIGKVALDQLLGSAAPLFYRRLAENQTLDFIQAERELFGTDHTEIGQRLAEKWSFPVSLTESIRYHHVPERAPQHGALAHIVFLANFLMSCFRAGLQLEKLSAALLAPRLAAIGLSGGQLEQVVDMIPMQVFDTAPERAIQA
jgi:putative nucleotidyltransferase with HDIG domain